MSSDTPTATAAAAHRDLHTHTHDHGHNHGNGHGQVDYASENREHYNRTAAEYDAIPGALETGAKIGQGIRDNYAFNPEKTRVLEFASGTGLISRELTAHTKSILGVDISQGMVDYYNKRFADQGLPLEKVHSIAAELKPDSPDSVPAELKNGRFDLVICSMAYHHFPDINAKTQLLASFLAPGGALLVVDIVKTATSATAFERAIAKRVADSEGSQPSQPHSRSHHHPHGESGTDSGAAGHDQLIKHGVAHVGGIAEDDIKAAFASASAQGVDMSTFEYRPFMTAKIWNFELPLFLAKVSRSTD